MGCMGSKQSQPEESKQQQQAQVQKFLNMFEGIYKINGQKELKLNIDLDIGKGNHNFNRYGFFLKILKGFTQFLNYLQGQFVVEQFDVFKIHGQFFRDRCYTFHQDTFVSEDNESSQISDYSIIFEEASKQNKKKIFVNYGKVKSPINPFQKLSNSQKIKIGEDLARHVQVNLCIQLTNELIQSDLREIIHGIKLMISGYGRIYHLLLDCRKITIPQLFKLLELFYELRFYISYETEFILNFSKTDNLNCFAEIFTLMQGLTNFIALDICVQLTPDDETGGIQNLSEALKQLSQAFKFSSLSSFALKFDKASKIDQNISQEFGETLVNFIREATLDSKPEVIRALQLNFSKMNFEKVFFLNLLKAIDQLSDPKLKHATRLHLLSFFSLNLSSTQINSTTLQQFSEILKKFTQIETYWNMQTLSNFTLNLSHNQIPISITSNTLSQMIEGLKSKKNGFFNYVNLNLSNCQCTEDDGAHFFADLNQINDNILKTDYNENLFQHFILNLESIKNLNFKFVDNNLKNQSFKNFLICLDKTFFTSKKLGHNCYCIKIQLNIQTETVSLNLSDCKWSQQEFDQLFSQLANSLQHFKPTRLHSKPWTLSTFMIVIRYLDLKTNLNLKEFNQFIVTLSDLCKGIQEEDEDYQIQFMNSFIIDLGSNNMKKQPTQQIEQSNLLLGPLSNAHSNFGEKVALNLSNCKLDTDQLNRVFDGLKLIAKVASEYHVRKNLRSLYLDFSHNPELSIHEKFDELLIELVKANTRNSVSFQDFQLNLESTQIKNNVLEVFKQKINALKDDIQDNCSALQSLKINLNNSQISSQSLGNILTFICLIMKSHFFEDLNNNIQTKQKQLSLFTHLDLNLSDRKLNREECLEILQFFQQVKKYRNLSNNLLSNIKISFKNVPIILYLILKVTLDSQNIENIELENLQID